MTKPVARFGVDWEDDGFICYDALRTDALNRLHTSLSSEPQLVNLHWNFVNKSVANSATSVAFAQEVTDYGIRRLRCVTGTGTTAGAYFGRTGSTNDFIVTNATVYTAVFWIKATIGSGVGFTFLMENSTGSQTFTISGSWQKITRTFTTNSTTTSFKITKTNSATDVTFDVAGFMIVDGSTAPNGFNAGDASNLYDNITQDVKNATFNLGKSNYDQAMIEEGKASLTLDNDSKRYSPEYSSSPLFGKVDNRRRFTVDIQTSAGVWSRRFTGWTANVEPVTGLTRNREASLKCIQGKTSLDRAKYNQTNTGDSVTADQIISQIAYKFMSAATPLQMVLNRGRLNAGYFVNPDDIMDLEVGISALPANGEEWVDAPLTKVIESIQVVDQGFFFIDRLGKLVYYNRDHYVDPALALTDTSVSMDSEGIASPYVYGANYLNTIRVNYYPPNETVDTVWHSTILAVPRSRVRKVVREVKFEFEEGKRINVASVNPFGNGVNDSTYVALTGTTDISSKIDVQFELKGGGGTLTITNPTTTYANVNVTLKGTIVERIGGQSVTVVDEAGLLGGQVLSTISSKLLNEEQDARNLADYMLTKGKQNVGQITNFQLLNKNDALLDKMLTLELGSKVTLSEAQTAHSGKTYYICGMVERWAADAPYTTTYQITPIYKIPEAWILGTSVLGTDTYLAY